MNNEEDDSDDLLGDLGLDDFSDEEDEYNVGGTNLPHRAGERICFVPVDKFQTMDNVASNVVPADDFSDDEHHEHKQQQSSSQPPPYMHSNIIESQSSLPPIQVTIDKKNKNIRFTKNMNDDDNDNDNVNDEESNHINNNYSDDIKNNIDDDPDDDDDFDFDIDAHDECDSPKTTATTNTPASISKSQTNHEINANINNIIGPLSTHSSKNIVSNMKDIDNTKKNYISESNLFRDYGEEGEIDLDSYSSADGMMEAEYIEEEESYSSSGSMSTDEDYDDHDSNQNTVRIHSNFLNTGSSTAHLRMNSSNGHSKSKLSSHHTLPNGASIGRNMMQTGSARNVSLRNLLPRNVSDLNPIEFDICLLISAPLAIRSNITQQPQQPKSMGFGSSFGARKSTFGRGINSRVRYNETEELQEYIRHSLPDRLELQDTVRQTLVRYNRRMRYTHFTATANSVFNFNRFGGCKILQFVGFCCNPRRDNGKFPELCKSLQFNGYNEDIDYILLETEVGDADEDNNICCFGKGKWYTIDELRAMNLNAEQTQIDTIIAMSPQHERMVEVFRQLGYQYVIGVESPKNTLKFSTTETAAFLEQFYAALLEQRSVSRAFYLSLQAALSTRGGNVRGGLDHDDKYLLTIDESLRDARFIVFADDQLEFGEIIDKSQHEKLPKTNLTEPVRPFIGRTSYVIKLLKYLIEHRILNVTGKELVGRASVVKSTTRYLLQMGFFRGGCFVIDCNISRKYQQKNKSFNEYVYDVLKFCGVNFKDPNNNHGHHHTTNLTGIQGINENEEDPDEEIIDEDDVPQMNGGYGSNGIFQGISNSTNHSVQSSADDHQVDDAQLTANNLNLTTNNSNVNTPMSRNARHSHYSSRSSVKFPPVSKIIGNGHEAATPSITSNNNNGYNALLSPAPSQIASPIVSTPTVNNYGNPKVSPRSLLAFLERSIRYDLGGMEPFCFVILNTNHWHGGMHEVRDWINDFSEQLFQSPDSRIICTGTTNLNIGNVPTLQMENLQPFDPPKLAKLFKHFLGRGDNHFTKFNPSQEEIEKHEALQKIFDGRPGMTKKVAQYVRVLVAENGMENDDEKTELNLDLIAEKYPKSQYAFNGNSSPQQNSQQTNHQKIFQGGSASLPPDFGKPQFKGIDDSSVNLHTNGTVQRQQNLGPSTSTPKLAQAGKQHFFQPKPDDPSVLIPDANHPDNLNKIMPNHPGGSPPAATARPHAHSAYQANLHSAYQHQQHQVNQQQQPQGQPINVLGTFSNNPNYMNSQWNSPIAHSHSYQGLQNRYQPQMIQQFQPNTHYVSSYTQLQGTRQLFDNPSSSSSKASATQSLNQLHGNNNNNNKQEEERENSKSAISQSTTALSRNGSNLVIPNNASRIPNLVNLGSGTSNPSTHITTNISHPANRLSGYNKSIETLKANQNRSRKGGVSSGVKNLFTKQESVPSMYSDKSTTPPAPQSMKTNESHKVLPQTRNTSISSTKNQQGISSHTLPSGPSFTFVISDVNSQMPTMADNKSRELSQMTLSTLTDNNSHHNQTSTMDSLMPSDARHRPRELNRSHEISQSGQTSVTTATLSTYVGSTPTPGLPHSNDNKSVELPMSQPVTPSHVVWHSPTYHQSQLTPLNMVHENDEFDGKFDTIVITQPPAFPRGSLKKSSLLNRRRSSSVPDGYLGNRTNSISRDKRSSTKSSQSQSQSRTSTASTSQSQQSTQSILIENIDGNNNKKKQLINRGKSIHVGPDIEHNYNKSNLMNDDTLSIKPNHSLQFSSLTETSIYNENVSHNISTPNTPISSGNHNNRNNNNNQHQHQHQHQKNPSYILSPKQSSSSYEQGNIPSVPSSPFGGHPRHNMDLTNGVQSAPVAYNNNKLTKNGTQYNEFAKGDEAILGINHSYSARKIWSASCLSFDNNKARLEDLYPNLIDEFKRLTKCDKRQPTLQQIELFFVRTGGQYEENDNSKLPFIHSVKFDKFFAWFRSMCRIIKDLRPMYNRAEDPLIGLFYSRNTSQETLEHKPEGTFILRLASQKDGLAITYKNPHSKIQNVLLTRITNEMYKVGKSDKETLLFQLIRPWDKLKYLYTPNKLIRKKFLF